MTDKIVLKLLIAWDVFVTMKLYSMFDLLNFNTTWKSKWQSIIGVNFVKY